MSGVERPGGLGACSLNSPASLFTHMSSERKLVAEGQDFLISCWFLIYMYFMISWAVAGCTFVEQFFPKLS